MQKNGKRTDLENHSSKDGTSAGQRSVENYKTMKTLAQKYSGTRLWRALLKKKEKKKERKEKKYAQIFNYIWQTMKSHQSFYGATFGKRLQRGKKH